MRDILFRGKRSDNGNWIQGSLFVRINDAYLFPLPIATSKAKVDPQTVGQFTGQIDKIGRKIFEGDILQTEDRLVVVVWNDRAGCWDSNFVRYIEKPSWTGITYSQWRRWATIIGNIHDNPELLE